MRGFVIACAIFTCAVCAPGFAFAGEKLMDFPMDKSSTYDIYFSTGKGHLSRAKNVKVLDVISFQGITFLMIEREGMKSDKGMILFGDVVAILPVGQPVDMQIAG